MEAHVQVKIVTTIIYSYVKLLSALTVGAQQAQHAQQCKVLTFSFAQTLLVYFNPLLSAYRIVTKHMHIQYYSSLAAY